MAKLSFHTHSLPDLHAFVHSRSNSLSAKPTSYSLRRRKLSIRAVNNCTLMEGAMTFYDVLSVSQCVELGELKKAYREKVRVYHPDVCPPGEREESSKIFLLVQEAYETLSDPMLRADYDFNLHFNPQIMLLNKRNESVRDGGKQQWADQLQRLNRSMGCMERNSWGGRMRRNQTVVDVPTYDYS